MNNMHIDVAEFSFVCTATPPPACAHKHCVIVVQPNNAWQESNSKHGSCRPFTDKLQRICLKRRTSRQVRSGGCVP
jgi:hypothetical protein